MTRKRCFRLFILGIVLVLGLTTGVTAAQDSRKVLTTATWAGDPHSIDPQQVIDIKDANLENVLFPALTILDDKIRQITPGLATRWDVSPDGKIYTFHLVQNVPWVRYNAATGAVEAVLDDSGSPRYVTAQDVLYGWTRALDPAVGSAGAYILAPMVVGGQEFNSGAADADALGLKVIDHYTFEVTAPEAVAYTLSVYGIINARPTPKWAIEENGAAWTEPENIHTYGPFALKEWVHDDHITYIKNPLWPGTPGYGQANLDELVVRFLDDAVQLREYEAGNLDTISISGAQFDRVKVDTVLGKELHVVAGLCSNVWSFHTQKAPFDNAHIRRAFSYALDRQSLVDNVIKRGSIPARWFTPPSVPFAPTPETNPDLGIGFDADKAKRELQLGLEDLGLSAADQLPPITAVFWNDEGTTALAQALQVTWQDALGITVALNPLDVTSYWATIIGDAGQITFAGWCPDYNDANNYTHDTLHSESIYNYGRWNNPEFDALVDEARVSDDLDRRRELYEQAEHIAVVDDAAVMPISWDGIPWLTKPYVVRTFSANMIESYWKWDITSSLSQGERSRGDDSPLPAANLRQIPAQLPALG